MTVRFLSGSLAALLIGAPALAQTRAATVDLGTVEVTSTRGVSRTELSPSVKALPANTTVLDDRTVQSLPVFSYGDVFRPLAGFDVSNYGQGGIGYGVSLRGFSDADHGRDIAVVIDGVPINEVSSIHTPNYADLNVLLPETVERVEVIRGPFSVEYGDANLGGAVVITTKRSEPFGTASLAGGSFGTARGVATFSQVGTPVEPFLAYEGFSTAGYRRNNELARYNLFNKATVPLDDGALSLRAQFYGTTFGAPGYVNRDLVRAGLLSPRAAVNRTDGGDKALQNVVANYVSGPPAEEVSGTLYVSHDTFNRYADFGGGQRGQEEERLTAGGRVRKVHTTSLFDVLPTQLLVGGSWRTDAIDVIAAPSVARALTGRSTGLDILQHNLAAFGQAQIRPTDWLKLTGGARIDQFVYDVTSRIGPGQSFDPAPRVVSPKAGAAVTPWSWLEVYANYGQGFRSPSAASELLDNPRLRPLKLESREVGAQISFERFTALADVYTTDIANEAFQPAPGLPVQSLGRSRREGFDVEGKLHVVKDGADRVSLFANVGAVEARLLNGPVSRTVPNVPSSILNVGAELDLGGYGPGRLLGTAYATFVGRKALSEDGALRTKPYSRVSARLAYALPTGLTAFSQATWYPGDRLSEVAFNFGPGVGATLANVYTSPQPRLTVLAGLKYGFATGR